MNCYDPLFSRRSSPLVGSSLTRTKCGYAHPRIDHGRVSWLACVQHASLYPAPSCSFNYSFDYYASILSLIRCCRKRGSVLLGPLESQTSSLQTVTCPKLYCRKRWEWICFSSRNLLELPQALQINGTIHNTAPTSVPNTDSKGCPHVFLVWLQLAGSDNFRLRLSTYSISLNSGQGFSCYHWFI